jgi:hypothetical protein
MTVISGCMKAAPPVVNDGPNPRQSAKASALVRDNLRQQMEQIPPPAKSRYLSIHTEDNWENPFLIVGPKMLTLRLMMADANPSQVGQGTMLRPSGARRQVLQIRMSDLPNALTSLPPEAWPYGRVIGVVEDGATERPQRPQMRRNVETVIQLLNDLGIVVDEWSGPNGGALR